MLIGIYVWIPSPAFIDAGGRARWDYLIFGLNPHSSRRSRSIISNVWDLKIYE